MRGGVVLMRGVSVWVCVHWILWPGLPRPHEVACRGVNPVKRGGERGGCLS